MNETWTADPPIGTTLYGTGFYGDFYFGSGTSEWVDETSSSVTWSELTPPTTTWTEQ